MHPTRGATIIFVRGGKNLTFSLFVWLGLGVNSKICINQNSYLLRCLSNLLQACTTHKLKGPNYQHKFGMGCKNLSFWYRDCARNSWTTITYSRWSFCNIFYNWECSHRPQEKLLCGPHVVQNCITWCLLFLTVRSLGYWLYRKSWKFIFQITYEPRILRGDQCLLMICDAAVSFRSLDSHKT